MLSKFKLTEEICRAQRSWAKAGVSLKAGKESGEDPPSWEGGRDGSDGPSLLGGST